jgi:cytochrome c peroxidase
LLDFGPIAVLAVDVFTKLFGNFIAFVYHCFDQQVDKGRFDVTHDSNDIYVFKVPSLRNVAMTPPYFHDGSVRSLPEAVRIMAKVQLGERLSDQDANDIVTFLHSLTGKLPEEFASAPVLPASGFEPTKAASVEQQK